MDQIFTFVSSHPFLIGTFLLLLALFIRNETRRGGQAVSAQQLVNMVNRDDAFILDVRDKKEYEAGHIVNAVNIPYAGLESRLTEIKDQQQRPVVVACKQGQHSGAAGTLLRKNGFEQVSRLTGGVAEWRNQNLPVVKS